MIRIFKSPSKYIQGPGLLGQLEEYTSKEGDKKIYILADSFIANTYKSQILSSYDQAKKEYRFELFGG